MQFHLDDNDASSTDGWPVSGASCPLMHVVAAPPGEHDWKFTKLGIDKARPKKLNISPRKLPAHPFF